MTQKTKVKEIENSVDDIDTVNEIILLLNQNKFLRRNILIKFLIKNHTKQIQKVVKDKKKLSKKLLAETALENKEANEKEPTNSLSENQKDNKNPAEIEVHYSVDPGYSEATINRKIKQMVKEGNILPLSYDDLSKIFVVNENRDEKASYLVTKETFELTLEIKEHLENNVFKYLESPNSVEKRAALWEIESYEKRFDITNKEIKRILKVLRQEADNNDNELINHFVQFIYNELITKKRVVIDKNEFISTFRKLLEKYSVFNTKTNKIREKVLVILSYLGDDIVVSKMKEDIDNLDDLSMVENAYCTFFAARIIENHRADLFELEIKLASEGRKEACDFLHKVRNRAKENLILKEPLQINEFPEKKKDSGRGENV